LAFGEDPVRGAVGLDPSGFVEDDGEHPGVAAGDPQRLLDGDQRPVPGLREPGSGSGVLGGHGEQDRGGDPVARGQLLRAQPQQQHLQQPVVAALPR
jgi:hypothetical protein